MKEPLLRKVLSAIAVALFVVLVWFFIERLNVPPPTPPQTAVEKR